MLKTKTKQRASLNPYFFLLPLILFNDSICKVLKSMVALRLQGIRGDIRKRKKKHALLVNIISFADVCLSISPQTSVELCSVFAL